MKKMIWLGIILACIGILNVNAAEYQSETLKEACEQENLTCNHTRENKDGNPSIYIFRGTGCPYCNSLLSFMSTIIDNYEVNVVVYQVKGTENMNLYRKVGKKFNFDAKTYPFMVIGNKTFDGYNSADDNDIKETLEEFVKMDTHYDVVAEVKDANDEVNHHGIVFVFIFSILAILGLIMGYRYFNETKIEK